ncbi:1-acyl-sn-glycerol-3-phosphate acyltransferase [Nakaseomyces bracarensis]|uniref:1-acyl-sn-glycerol-3-phosphate acyltransferase n=1 Tax=Nakaseomyces bracarensis TaxID=273131 RepID=A0ABR4NNK4_9SACH
MSFLGKVLYYTRATSWILLLLLSAAYGTIASVVLTLVGKQHLAQWSTARFHYFVMSKFLGVKVKVINEHILENKPFIAVSNHQSTLDILFLGRIFPPGCTVTAKKSLKYVPFLGWFMALSGTLFLDRANRDKSVTTLNRGLEKVREQKRALWIFPEGTRSYSTTPKLLPLKKGAFHLAQQGKIPIVPVVVSNTSTIFCSKYSIFNRGTIYVKVLEPIPTKDLKKEDVSELTEKVRSMMEKEIDTLGYSEAIDDTGVPPEATRLIQDHVSTSTKSDYGSIKKDSATVIVSSGSNSHLNES